MRVLHLTTEFPPVIYGGLGTAVGGWVNASARAGISVAVQLVEGPLALDADGRGYGQAHESSRNAVGGIQPRSIVFYPCSSTNAASYGVQLVRNWRPHIVHLHTAMLWYVAQAIQQSTGIPIVYHIHSVDRAEYEVGEEPNPWLQHNHEQERAIEHADRLIALGRSEHALLNKYFPRSGHKVRIVGNGIEDSASVREHAYGRGHGHSCLILYSGRMVERKGIRELLTAIPHVLTAAPQAGFVFVGGPPPLTGSQVAAQWLDARHEPFRHRMHFTGWQPPAEVSRWYRLADILVVPSRYEPFGMVVLEGMLHGLVVVAADIGGPAEIIRHGSTGWLFPARDSAALAESLGCLVERPRLRQRLSKGAADSVRHDWAWEQKLLAMRSIYGECIVGPAEK